MVSENVNNGITVANGSSGFLLVKETTVAHNNFGLVAGGGAGMLVSRSVIVANGTGLFATTGGVLYSYGNNEVNANSLGRSLHQFHRAEIAKTLGWRGPREATQEPAGPVSRRESFRSSRIS